MIVLSCFSSLKIRKFDLVLRSTKQQFMAVTENLSSILGQGAFSPIADTDRIPRMDGTMESDIANSGARGALEYACRTRNQNNESEHF